MTRIFGEKYALLGCCETAAHDEHILAGEKLTVTGRAVCHAVTSKLFFAFKVDHAGMSTGGKQDAKASQLAPIGINGLDLTLYIQTLGLSQQELCAKLLGLTLHGSRQRRTAGALDARVVDHLCRNGNLSAKVLLFQHQYTISRPRQINGCGQTGRSASDDDNIIEIIAHLAHPLQLADQIQAGLEGLCARLPLCRAYLVTVLSNKLARLYAA